MNFKLSDNKIILLLLIALFLQIGVLLWHLEFFEFQRSDPSNNNGILAGQIIQLENSTKRRPLNSLLWGKSEKHDNVYFHDSILTLSQSTAKILLANNTQIDLSENTLITIESPDKKSSNEIRIHFTQGSLQARNPYKNTSIKDKNVTINLVKDSNVRINKDDKNGVEVEVIKGTANIEYQDSTIQLNEKSILELNAGKTRIETIDNTISWLKTPPARIYTHDPFVDVTLSWTLKPSILIVDTQKKKKKRILLKKGANTKKLRLEIGSHKIVLKSGTRRSKTISIEVWQAPTISLISPLPRDRKKYGDIEFIWTKSERVNSYQIKLMSDGKTTAYDTTDNKINLPLNEDLNLKWSVWGVDSKGFIIPPAYDNTLYIRESLFKAPKIKKSKTDKVKKKPNQSGFLNYLFFENAYAEDDNSTYLSWETIPEASFYIIEISNTKDFRSPLVQRKIGKPEYLWNSYNPNTTSYWRVAAEDNRGRMGLFSEPIIVEYIRPPAPIPEKIITTKITKKNEPKKIVKLDKVKVSIHENTLNNPLTQTTDIPAKDTKSINLKSEESPSFFDSFKASILPSYSITNYKHEINLSTKLSGISLLNFFINLESNLNSNSQLGLIFHLNKTTYQPSPKENFPFQENLEILKIDSQLYYRKRTSNWSFGISIRSDSIIIKSAPEAVATQNELSYGPLVQYNTNLWRGTYLGNFSVEFGQNMLGVQSVHYYDLPIFWIFRGGINLEIGKFSGNGYSRDYLGSSLSLGFSF